MNEGSETREQKCKKGERGRWLSYVDFKSGKGEEKGGEMLLSLLP